MPVILRPEQPADRAAIAALVEHAFGQPDEARLITRLRADGDLILSLVADDEGTILGHVALSLMTAPFRALGLAPVAVAPGHQRQGIAAALIREALDRAR
ncbi:MAG: GNAT family N-acetyltransferase, partial [Allosphingosinicella sp.]